MRILIAPDKFKGTLSAVEAAAAIGAALEGHERRVLPVADGGEGTARVVGEALGGRRMEVEVTGPLGAPVIAAFWLVHRDEGDAGLAVMEMSSASGFGLLSESEHDPWRATTRGTGELLLAARAAGVDEILIGIGGSATNDGGAGVAQALGYRFLDGEGLDLDEIPERLMDVVSMFPDLAVDLPEVTVACDVTNPLLGESGATRVYGPQKGVAPGKLEEHEQRLEHFAVLVNAELGCEHRDAPGAGAAGGLGFGLMSFCDAQLRPGFELVSEVLGLRDAIEEADLVITGEGRLDAQSLMGKAPVGVADMARAAGKPVVAFCGTVDDREAVERRFDGVYSLVEEGGDASGALAHPAEVLKNRVAECRSMIEGWAP